MTAVSSGSVDLLIALNQNFFNAVWWDANATVVASALTAGTLKKLRVYDRYANNDVKFPGVAPGCVVQGTSDFIEPISPLDSPNVGPAGTVGTWSGCASNHGYIVPVGALSQAEFHFRRQVDLQPMSVQFCYDQRLVYFRLRLEASFFTALVVAPIPLAVPKSCSLTRCGRSQPSRAGAHKRTQIVLSTFPTDEKVQVKYSSTLL